MTEKIKQTCSYVSESLDKVRSTEWAEPVACVLKVTGTIVQGLGNFVPGLGILGGAFILGTKLLNPQPKLSDLRKTEKSLKLDIEKFKSKSVSSFEIDSLSKDLDNVQNSITNFKESHSELIDDFAVLKLDVRDQFKTISKEMKSLESDVKDLKDLVTATFELIVDQRYKDGIESIEAAYQTFLDGSNNIEATLLSFDYYIVELQSNFNQHLKPEKLEEYLRIINRHKGAEMCHQMFNYILVVKSKYLQIMTVYYIHKNDVARVSCNFERFNKHYFELEESLDKVLKEEMTETQNSSIPTTVFENPVPNTPEVGRVLSSSTNNVDLELNHNNTGSTLKQMTTKGHPKDQRKTTLITYLKDKKKVIIPALVVVCILMAFIILALVSKSDSTVFLMVKTVNVGQIKIRMTKGLKINNPKYSVAKASGKVQFCNGKKVNDLLQSINDKKRTLESNKILVIDLGVTKCKDLLSKSELQNANLAGLVILDSPDLNYKSMKSVLKKIHSYPAISFQEKDVKNFLKSVVRDGATVEIWFGKLEDVFKYEDFYNVDCNLSEQCIHLYTPHPQQVYLGCEGVPKYRTEPDITCMYSGAECVELAKLKIKFQQFSTCAEKEGLPYKKGSTMWPTPTCHNATEYRSLDKPISCPGEDPFWTDELRNRLSTVCYTAKRQTSLIISRQTTKGTKLCDAKVRSCKSWGPWFDSGCSISNHQTNEWSQTRYRYCKHSAQCVLIETEVKYGVGGCNKFFLVEGADRRC
eukprot:GFUD01027228.1.p1 GENE.GFUD01027228.1~~GFUD01027228.1.p1  ORF type:complete len:752 (+),score=153.06 GFUD01027228.1:200-2455(+)